MTVLHLRPRPFTELVDAAFTIVKARFGALASGAAIIVVSWMTFQLAFRAALPPAAVAAFDARQRGAPGRPAPGPNPLAMVAEAWATSPAMLLLAAALLAAFVVVGLVAFGALVQVAARTYLGEPAELGPALAAARRHLRPLLRATVTKYLAAAAGFVVTTVLLVRLAFVLARDVLGGNLLYVFVVLQLLGVVALIVPLVRWSMTAPVAVLEGVRGGEALARSAQLTRGQRMRLTGIAVLFVVLAWAVAFANGALLQLLTPAPWIARTLSNLSSLVTLPFQAALLVTVYYDLRIRNEGLDLELLSARLAPVDTAHSTAASNALAPHA